LRIVTGSKYVLADDETAIRLLAQYTIHIYDEAIVHCNNNNNDRLTAFDPGQPG